ncbi:glyoxalase/Bleomycin resistance protein/Dioxygenase [Colletotrichum abscissum]|uniref:Glyoxalase/Bleomycin resistance protein/Dioxygenase n=1 Tax=Colletotrichum abscissum TaxID=1671311 RepID=A0A9P9XFR7_9PEZI|nr:glyoxalase/Bleomycin resistance protein/Dioxygenase [Colletotrichum abscissum]KAI3553357.1 glyoxalase/Bleomycin resistance protein/Dioxygenase [Colletotrichum abscissum]KAK1480307.1 glyoxalase/Bleomycin resistance protein/Dioxygenase [Colletotrichum abscissum]
MSEICKVLDYDAPVGKVKSPSGLAHVVLRTGNLPRMVDFYTTFLGGSVTYGNEMISFITYDNEHHRIALIGVPGTAIKNPASCGLEHIAFSFDTLEALLLAYRHRKIRGIEPVWCVNHGPTTSIYYKDPDCNMLETQVDNFDTVDEATAFMMSDAFTENPIGVDFDADDMIGALRAGGDEKVLKKRREIGPHGLPDFSSM